ncbi:MAG: DUF4838 domain-containing protein [Fimbriimonas sp.]|nr:DUF4838 domain-containing protein [Fimbriimonas sp.]
MLLSTLALAGACACAAIRPDTSFVVVDRGVAKTTIDLPAQAPGAERRAAEILRHAVKEMSGVDLPIRFVASPGSEPAIQIGFTSATETQTLKADGFSVDVTASAVRIGSGGRKGSIYGVVDLLERHFGCRCFSPTAYVFPKRKTLRLPIGSYSDQPVNSFRAINGDFDANEDWLDWQRLNNVNEMFGTGYYVHTFHRLVPPETHFKEHPEFFAVINGRHDASQLCPSRPENVEIAVETLERAMALDPTKQVWSVSQNDNPEYCHCPDCLRIIKEEGSPSGPIIRFVNAIARRFPHKTISTLAYEFSRSAPKVTRPDANVQIMLCTIELSRSAPIATEPTSASFRQDIVDWGKISHNIYLWDYTVDFAHQITPFPNIKVLQPNIRFFVENNAFQHFQQSNTSPGHEFSELKSYLIARILWNPNADIQAIEREFLAGYYGQAAPSIRSYIQAIERSLRGRLDIFGSPIAHVDDMLSAKQMTQYGRLFDQAEAAVAHDDALLQRVKVARLSIQYAALSVAADRVFGPTGFFDEGLGKPELRTDMSRMIDDFASTCVQNHVRSVNESNLTPHDFCEAIRRLTILEMDGNLAFRKQATATPPPSTKYGHGDIALLTNGVHGANDFHVQWLGWEGTDFDVTMDLGRETNAHEAQVDSLSSWQSWILHPKAITCLVSSDGKEFEPVGTETFEGDARHLPIIHTFKYQWNRTGVRYVKLHVQGTLHLPEWHSAAGGQSWVFLDEIAVR